MSSPLFSLWWRGVVGGGDEAAVVCISARAASCLLWSLGLTEWIMILFPRPRGWIVVLWALNKWWKNPRRPTTTTRLKIDPMKNREKLVVAEVDERRIDPTTTPHPNVILPTSPWYYVVKDCESCAGCRLPDWIFNLVVDKEGAPFRPPLCTAATTSISTSLTQEVAVGHLPMTSWAGDRYSLVTIAPRCIIQMYITKVMSFINLTFVKWSRIFNLIPGLYWEPLNES